MVFLSLQSMTKYDEILSSSLQDFFCEICTLLYSWTTTNQCVIFTWHVGIRFSQNKGFKMLKFTGLLALNSLKVAPGLVAIWKSHFQVEKHIETVWNDSLNTIQYHLRMFCSKKKKRRGGGKGKKSPKWSNTKVAVQLFELYFEVAETKQRIHISIVRKKARFCILSTHIWHFGVGEKSEILFFLYSYKELDSKTSYIHYYMLHICRSGHSKVANFQHKSYCEWKMLILLKFRIQDIYIYQLFQTLLL